MVYLHYCECVYLKGFCANVTHLSITLAYQILYGLQDCKVLLFYMKGRATTDVQELSYCVGWRWQMRLPGK